MIYIIAGASLSGKSTLRKRVTVKYGINGIDTDTLRTVASKLRPDLVVGHDKSCMTNYSNMPEVIEAFIYARNFFTEDFVLEGDAIQLALIRKLQDRNEAKAVILGYPNDTLNQRLNLLEKVGENHWSRAVDSQTLNQKISEFITYSQFLKSEAAKYNLTFIEATYDTSLDVLESKIIGILFPDRR
jgi:adenylate kinase family enzyme